MLKRFFASFFVPLFIFLASSEIVRASEQIIIFGGQGCPHCALVEEYVQDSGLEQAFNIERKEIYFNLENQKEFNRLADEYGVPIAERGVPAAIVDGEWILGDIPIINSLKAKLEGSAKDSNSKPSLSGETSGLTLPLVLGAAAVDAINPCAFAVLITLATTILASGNRKRVLLAGLAFALAIYISYLLMGLGAYRALSTVGLSLGFIRGIGGLALVIGLLNIKDFFWYGKGFIMEVPLSWRPKLNSLIQSVTSPVGAFFIGFLVSLFLLPCTSGPYIVILGMLSQKATFMVALGWLLLYNLIFILPMIIITLAVYKGFSLARAEATRRKRLRLLHLIAGVIMTVLGIVILTSF